MSLLQKEWMEILSELTEMLPIKKGELIVIGCSTSEVNGKKIGTSGSLEIAEVIYKGLVSFQAEKDFNIAVQCCEHLNRALVMEESVALERGYTIVQAIPSVKAGGALASVTYRNLSKPVLVEHIQAEYGIDIGSTLIGMHLKHVAIPVRLTRARLGFANVNFAYSRPKYIGGPRTIYQLQEENTDCS